MLVPCSGWVVSLQAMSGLSRVIGGVMLIVALLFTILVTLQVVFLMKVGSLDTGTRNAVPFILLVYLSKLYIAVKLLCVCIYIIQANITKNAIHLLKV